MKNRLVSNVKSAVTKLGCGIMAGLLLPGNVHGCACGCGVFDVGTSVKFYADSEFPVYQNFTGYQLAAPVLFKLGLSFMF